MITVCGQFSTKQADIKGLQEIEKETNQS